MSIRNITTENKERQVYFNIKRTSFFPIDESVLMDLKALLVEAKQKVPPVLQVLQTGDETMLDIGGESFTPNLVHISCSRPTCSPFMGYSHVLSFSFLNVALTWSGLLISNSQKCGVFANPLWHTWFSCFHRREGLYILRRSGSSYYRLP